MSARRSGSSPDSLLGPGRPSLSARVLARVVEGVSRPLNPAATAYVARLRRINPGATPAEIVTKLEKRYLTAVTIAGLGVGLTATLPGIGTLTALAAAVGETVLFLEATALLVLALASVYGIPVEQGPQRQRALVLSVLVGEGSKAAVAELLGPARTRGGWVADGMATLPLLTVAQLNWRMLTYIAKRYTLRRSALLFGKLLPMGIGAVIGAIGNRIAGKKIVSNSRAAFGIPPARWPVALHLLQPIRDAS
ncbi:MAG: hypothetical protein K2Q25_03315 [Mycobacteriaceae bacterium]|nr:hypothetical protein [Mycobacteriaceae bacterium]